MVNQRFLISHTAVHICSIFMSLSSALAVFVFNCRVAALSVCITFRLSSRLFICTHTRARTHAPASVQPHPSVFLSVFVVLFRDWSRVVKLLHLWAGRPGFGFQLGQSVLYSTASRPSSCTVGTGNYFLRSKAAGTWADPLRLHGMTWGKAQECHAMHHRAHVKFFFCFFVFVWILFYLQAV
jgi:hypothetical protein